MSNDDYHALDDLDRDGQSAALLAALDFTTPTAMDRAVCALFAQMTAHCRLIAEAREEPLPQPVFERMQAFMRRELDLQ